MKSPMTQMQEWIETQYHAGIPVSVILDYIKHIGIDSEKQSIVNAVKFGNGRASVDDKESLGELYYSNNYKPTPKKGLPTFDKCAICGCDLGEGFISNLCYGCG